MKRKIDTIKGKRLVMGGGTNLLTKDEILVTETPSGIELKERSADGKIKDLTGNKGTSDSADKKQTHMCIEALEDLTISYSGNSLLYSTDTITWVPLEPNQPTEKITAGSKVYFKSSIKTAIKKALAP